VRLQFLHGTDSIGSSFRRRSAFSGEDIPDDSDSFPFPFAPLYGLEELAGSSDREWCSWLTFRFLGGSESSDEGSCSSGGGCAGNRLAGGGETVVDDAGSSLLPPLAALPR
jgi:hypothetical protein